MNYFTGRLRLLLLVISLIYIETPVLKFYFYYFLKYFEATFICIRILTLS